MRLSFIFLAALLAAPLAQAAELNLALTVPSMKVAEYHSPYVAVWIEHADAASPAASVAANLAVWYQQKATKAGDGTKWLADLRQWWRRSGRNQSFPLDGVSGATRAAGKYQLRFKSTDVPLKSLAPGNYQLVVEAAREVGGRELVKLAFAWPPTAANVVKAQGKTELGEISLELTP